MSEGSEPPTPATTATPSSRRPVIRRRDGQTPPPSGPKPPKDAEKRDRDAQHKILNSGEMSPGKRRGVGETEPHPQPVKHGANHRLAMRLSVPPIHCPEPLTMPPVAVIATPSGSQTAQPEPATAPQPATITTTSSSSSSSTPSDMDTQVCPQTAPCPATISPTPQPLTVSPQQHPVHISPSIIPIPVPVQVPQMNLETAIAALLTGQSPLARVPFSPSSGGLTPDDARVRALVLKIIFKLLDPSLGKNGSFVAAFQALDSNRDGKISSEELYQGLRNWGIDITPEEVNNFGKKADTDGDGFLSTTEFVRLVSHFNALLQQDFHQRVMKFDVGPGRHKKKPLLPNSSGHEILRRVVFEIMAQGQGVDALFNLLDDNKDGKLTLSELAVGLRQVGVKVEIGDLAALGDVYDINSDGSLGPEEFVAMLKDMNCYLQDYFTWHIMSTKSPLEHFMYRLIFKVMEFDANLIDVFAQFDKNGDGLLTVEEFFSSLRGVGLDVMPHEAKILGELFDSKKDGVLDVNEFIEMVSKINGAMQERFMKNLKQPLTHPEYVAAKAKLHSIVPNPREREIAQRLIFQCMRVDKNIVDIFNAFDKDGRHALTPIQLADGIVSFGVSITAEEAERLIRLADTNMDGVVDVYEFVALVEQFNTYLQMRLKWRVMNIEMRRQHVLCALVRKIQELGGAYNVVNVYRALDLRHNQSLTVAEFGIGLMGLGIHIPVSELRMLFFAADKNNDGVITLDEFCDLLGSAAEKVSEWEAELAGVMPMSGDY
eukprot:TRINITY_DN84409_c0_g1_i1.p1 TRINITY_DN84409_c0_g1~~TRINITY_DN84409_c0_g1_i1.p1  ORF type:complete len:770 (+),score=93.92 TRINITY_DN84409_c0_g1_i1:46-2355(+)